MISVISVDEKFSKMTKDLDPFGEYLLSNYGRVYSLKRDIFLHPMLNNRGYPRVDIRYTLENKDIFRKTILLHIAVVKTFGDCEGNKLKKKYDYIDGAQIDHLSKNKENPCYKNLQIVSRQENIKRRDLDSKSLKIYIQNEININIEEMF